MFILSNLEFSSLYAILMISSFIIVYNLSIQPYFEKLFVNYSKVCIKHCTLVF